MTTTVVAGRELTPLQIASGIVGIVFVLVGLLGFVPGVTTNYSEMTLIGHESDAMLLGVFQVNVAHNLFHLLFGVVGLAAAGGRSAALYFLVVGGAIYLLLWIFGLVIDLDSPINLVSLNTADNWLHFGLGVGMVAVGAALAAMEPPVSR